MHSRGFIRCQFVENELLHLSNQLGYEEKLSKADERRHLLPGHVLVVLFPLVHVVEKRRENPSPLVLIPSYRWWPPPL